MAAFFPSTASFLLAVARDLRGIGQLSKRAALETYIHNFMSTHDLREELPAFEEFFSELRGNEDDWYDAYTNRFFFNLAPPFTMSFIDSFAQRCNDY